MKNLREIKCSSTIHWNAAKEALITNGGLLGGGGGLGGHPLELFKTEPLFPAIWGHSVVALLKFLKAIFFIVCVAKSGHP